MNAWWKGCVSAGSVFLEVTSMTQQKQWHNEVLKYVA
jgi:hypothetical protein